jgi:hypothetical protein
MVWSPWLPNLIIHSATLTGAFFIHLRSLDVHQFQTVEATSEVMALSLTLME